MKYRKIILFLFVIIAILSFKDKVYAASESPKVVSDLEEKYSLYFHYRNTENYELDVAYVGQELSELNIIASFREMTPYRPSILVGYWEWENPNYKIDNSIQIVNARYICEDMIFTIKIQITPEDFKGIEEISTDNISIESGLTYDMKLLNTSKNNSYIWASSDTNVVKVNAKTGKIRAIKQGSAVVTCKVTTENKQNYLLTANVKVGKNDRSISLNKTKVDLEIGKKIDLDLENSNVKAIFYTGDKSIVAVNSKTGLIRGVKKGRTAITCVVLQGRTAVVMKCDVTVTTKK